MFSYRITKYNPKNRNPLGWYLKDEWTAISDNGTIYDKKEFTIEEYLEVEETYAKSILIVMDFLKLDTLTLSNFHQQKIFYPNLLTNEMIEIYKSSRSGEKITKEKIYNLTKLILREEASANFESKDMVVHFGYDYYMYIMTSKELPGSLRDKIESMGLFVEDFESPYLHLDE